MKSYSFLKVISNLLAFNAYLFLIGGIAITVFAYANLSHNSYNESYVILYPLVPLIASVLLFIILMAMSQFIILMIDIAQRAANIDHNIVVIAENTTK